MAHNLFTFYELFLATGAATTSYKTLAASVVGAAACDDDHHDEAFLRFHFYWQVGREKTIYYGRPDLASFAIIYGGV
jgi:hypothetical protein